MCSAAYTVKCKNCMRQSRPCHYSSGIAYVGSFAAVESSADSPKFGTFSLHTSPDGSSGASPTGNQPLYNTMSHPSPPKDLSLPALPSINCQDLELMHHYTLFTYRTLAHSPTLEAIWRDQFPREGFSHTFLLHGILAVSALHIMLTSPIQSRLFFDLAIQHHTLAINLYTPVLNSVTPGNCHALFGFSSIAPVISFGVSQASGHTGHDLVQDMIKIFHMLQGITAVVHMAWEHVKAGPLGPLISPIASYHDVLLSSDAADALLLLEDRCAAVTATDKDEDEALKAGCSAAIDRLRDAFKGASIKKDDRTVAIMWPILVPRPYLDAAHDCKPAALAILAHYAVLLHDLRNCWWAGDRGVRTVEAISECLGSEWEDVLKWPKMKIACQNNGTMV